MESQMPIEDWREPRPGEPIYMTQMRALINSQAERIAGLTNDRDAWRLLAKGSGKLSAALVADADSVLREALDSSTKDWMTVNAENARLRSELSAVREQLAELLRPIDMVLYCPQCGLQHVDAPDGEWTNPPHRSHLCHGCGHVWRQADVATNGVQAVKTTGQADSPLTRPFTADSVERATATIELLNDESAKLHAELAAVREQLRAQTMRLKQTAEWRDYYRHMWNGTDATKPAPPTDADLEIAIRVATPAQQETT